MFYTVYKTTNKVNNKIYVGMHKTNNLEDGYLGSGKRLRRAIRKYGLENFEKEILYVFDNEQDMRLKEAELVSETFVADEDTYNLTTGGGGGFYYINANGLGCRFRAFWNEESREKMRQLKIGTKLSFETKEKLKQSSLKNNTIKYTYQSKKRPKTKEHKHAISESVKQYFLENPDAAIKRNNMLKLARTFPKSQECCQKISEKMKLIWNSGKRYRPTFDYVLIQEAVDTGMLKKEIYTKYNITKNQFDHMVKKGYIVV